jgi:NitT/TauT family transport system substrate-binding protein
MPEWKRRRLQWLTAFLSIAIFLSGCGAPPPESAKPLQLGANIWPPFVMLHIAVQQGFCEPGQIESQMLSSSADVQRAFVQHRFDVEAMTLFEAIRTLDEGTPLRIILVLDYSNGADGIIAHEEIEQVADLKGKRVGVERSSVGHFTLLSALKQAGLQETDVEMVNLTLAEISAAFDQGKIDAAVTWEPYLSDLDRHEKTHKIFTSAEIPGQIVDVLVVHDDVAEQQPENIIYLLKGWNEIVTRWRQDPQAIEELITPTMQIASAEMQANFAGIAIQDIVQNQHIFHPDNPQSLWNAYNATITFMQTHHLLKNPPPDPATVLDAQFVEAALQK